MQQQITLKSLYNFYIKHPEGQWIMQWPNAVELYNFIKNNPVKRVLGLGTGVGLSDAVIAFAMIEKGETDYVIDSMEQYDKCITLANQMIPEPLKKNINIIKSNVIVWNDPSMPYENYSIYETMPEGDYDLIINDGPAPFMEGDKYIDLPNGTIHKMLIDGKLKAGTKIIYDGRIQSLKLLERYFSDNLLLVHIPARNNDFNVLEKKDVPFIFRDDKLEMMKTTTNYFKEPNENIVSSDQSGPQSQTTDSIEGAK